jgi:general secretion pathway protein C
MKLRDLITRNYRWLLLSLVAAMAYFQAAGLSALVGVELLNAELASLPAPQPAWGAPRRGRESRSARPIVARNPFDSITGPLDAKPAILPDPLRAPVDPLTVSKCDGIDVTGTTEDEDPLWSMAVVQAPGERHGSLRRVGDLVGGKYVAYIGYNQLERSPSVWLASGETLCQSLLFDADPPPPPPAPKPPAKPANAPKRAQGSPLPKSIADKIRKLSDTQVLIDRSAVDTVMQQYAKLTRSVRVVPEQKDGRVRGIRIQRIPPSSLLEKLGFVNGDRIDKINGFALSSPEKALQAYAHLRTASRFSVQLERKGRPMTIDYLIR